MAFKKTFFSLKNNFYALNLKKKTKTFALIKKGIIFVAEK